MTLSDSSHDRDRIAALSEKFSKEAASGALRSYSEEDTKKNFILPLFEALGWDVLSRHEVTAEETISSKRVDYGFYLDGHARFYLEAKAAKADIQEEQWANQAIRYSWNKGVTWAVLTNFERLIVFNAQDIERSLADKQLFDIPFTDFATDERVLLLSKDAISKNELDIYAEKYGKKFKRVPVSAQLYEDLNEARELLTNELGAWNEGLKKNPDLLDEGVQKLLDRLIFIRVAEDRGVEPQTLIPLLREWKASKTKNQIPLFQSMVSKFRELDDIYNSNLFKEHAFEKWDDGTGSATEGAIQLLEGKRGYYEYDFKVMPADVLGTVYEQYLGHRLSKSRKGLALDKDAGKRKEQGIYYTPTFVVDYIVKHALSPVLDKCKTIDDLHKIKILDPACGSGSFLIKALEVLYEKYREFGQPEGEMTKFVILTKNLYGVDLDEQAVEIARLNLLINALDSRIKLPNLTNIRCGNSLITGTDAELKKRFGPSYRDKRAFNWNDEFPEVFGQGGFDVIIGNPPYIKEFVNKSAFDGLHESPYYQGKMDLWTMFGCVSIDLLNDTGIVSFIAPNNWLTNAGASIFRDKILKEGELKTFIDFGDYKVFDQAGIQTMIYVFQKQSPSQKYIVEYLRLSDKNIAEENAAMVIAGKKVEVEIEPEKLIGKSIAFSGSESNSLFDKLETKKNFELAEKEVGQGIVAAPDKYFLEKDISEYSKDEKEFLKMFYTASGRYASADSDNYIFYLSDKNFGNKKLKNYPNIEKHFVPFEKVLTEAKIKYGTPDKPYFYLHREREERFFNSGPKIVCGVRVKFPQFFYTEDEYYGSRALNFIKSTRINLKYLAAILNSRLSYFWLKNRGKQLGDLLQIDKGPLLEIPIYVPGETEQKDVIVLVDEISALSKDLQSAQKNSNEWDRLIAEIEKIDKRIDGLIYKLYELTDEEIEAIEK